MAWHIFKKDARLLWSFALAIAVAQGISAGIHTLLGYFNQSRELRTIADAFPFIVMLGIMLLNTLVAQQDPLPGTRQDWLVRPIKRRDLLLAKLLFSLLMISAPIFALDMIEQSMQGFYAPSAAVAALSRAVSLFITFSIPGLLLGAITQSLAEAMIFGVICAVGFTLLFPIGLMFGFAPFTIQQGPGWFLILGAYGILTVCGAVTLMFQYLRRRTLFARAMAVGSVFAAMLFLYLPFGPCFAVQQWIASSSAPPPPIAIRFTQATQAAASPADRSTHSWTDPTTATARAVTRLMNQRMDSTSAILRLPMRVTGLRGNGVLLADQVLIRLVGQNGEQLYGSTQTCVRDTNGVGLTCTPYSLEIRANDSSAAAIDSTQILRIPVETYNRIKDQSLRLELDYALTYFSARPQETIGIEQGPSPLSGFGLCATRPDADGDEIEVSCLTAKNTSSCATVVLQDPGTGLHNPEIHACSGDYAPFPLNRYEDVIGRFAFGLQFDDPSGLIRFPVDAKRIRNAELAITSYEPRNHFTQSLVIPEIRLRDWASTKG